MSLPTPTELMAAIVAREELPPERGETGREGKAGEIGPQGPQGFEGPRGPKGNDGATGNPGAMGPKGDPGPVGPKGDKGEKGEKGDKGDDGERGPQGIPGPRGRAIGGIFGGGGGSSGGGSQTALTTPFTPAGTISATNVQAAIEEVAAEAGGGIDYVQVTDPGAVGARKTWFLPAGPNASVSGLMGGLYVRNDADDDWLRVGSLRVAPSRTGWTYGASADDTSWYAFTNSPNGSLSPANLDVGADGIHLFTRSSTQFTAGLHFRDGRLYFTGPFGDYQSSPSIQAGDDPNAAPIDQKFTITPTGVWTGGTFSLADDFNHASSFFTDDIAWDADASAVETALNDWFGVPGAFTVTGGPFPTAMEATLQGQYASIYPAFGSNDLIGTDPDILFVSTQDSQETPDGPDGSLFLAPDALYQMLSGTWTVVGGGSVTPATDPGDIADPTLATPESNALKLNALMGAMRTAGMLA